MTEKKQPDKTDETQVANANAKNPYEVFETDAVAEVEEGAKFEFPGGWVMIARAGGRNEAYDTEVARRLQQWHEDNPDKDTIPADEDRKLMIECYAKTCLKAWGSDMYGPGKMPGRDGEPMTWSQRNVTAFFVDLPELWQRAVRFANRFENYRSAKLKDTIKN